MNALYLIEFLLPPKIGKIHALNSPFDQEIFKIEAAQKWVERGKAVIEDGILIFHDQFRLAIVQQFADRANYRREDQAYERLIDYGRSQGKTMAASMVRFEGRHSGRRPMPGGPETRVMQLVRRAWKPGTFPKDEDETQGAG